jgi:hypothetical protein
VVFVSPCPPHRAKGKKACVECANIQQPTANIQFAPPSLNNGYWILDIFTFPAPHAQSGSGQVDSCKWFHGLLLSIVVPEPTAWFKVNVTIVLSGYTASIFCPS